MRIRTIVSGVAAVSFLVSAVVFETPTSAQGRTEKRAMVPRTPSGHPDLSGTWSHNSATPLQRPLELAGRTTLTDAEMAALKKTAAELFNGETDAAFGDSVFMAALRKVQGTSNGFTSTDTTGNYNHSWIVDREFFDNRTSLISDPPDGRMPALTEAAKAREAAVAARRKLHPYDGPESIVLGQRCITGTVPLIGAGYNNYYNIGQTADHVVIQMEMRHDTRIVPLDGRPHVSSAIRSFLGDARGRWEGDTLVVDTTNFNHRMDFRIPGDEHMHLVERFTRIDPTTLRYEATIDDPTVYTRPWTITTFFKKTTDRIYEYACHEGNEAMTGTLNGARMQEKKAQAARATSSR
jgi:hypothetical protein